MIPIYVRIMLTRRGLAGTSFRGDFVRAHAKLPNNSSRNFNIWTFLKIDLAQAAPLSGVCKSSPRMTVRIVIGGDEKRDIFGIFAEGERPRVFKCSILSWR